MVQKEWTYFRWIPILQNKWPPNTGSEISAVTDFFKFENMRGKKLASNLNARTSDLMKDVQDLKQE